jgi:hypothetical protein
MWIARDEGAGNCHLFNVKPIKVYDKYCRKWKWASFTKEGVEIVWDGLILPAQKYKLITFENSPIEVELKLK